MTTHPMHADEHDGIDVDLAAVGALMAVLNTAGDQLASLVDDLNSLVSEVDSAIGDDLGAEAFRLGFRPLISRTRLLAGTIPPSVAESSRQIGAALDALRGADASAGAGFDHRHA